MLFLTVCVGMALITRHWVIEKTIIVLSPRPLPCWRT